MYGDIARSLPVSIEAEQSVLGSVMIDPSCMDTVATLISRDDLYMP
jgi:replicative DNA helicase